MRSRTTGTLRRGRFSALFWRPACVSLCTRSGLGNAAQRRSGADEPKCARWYPDSGTLFGRGEPVLRETEVAAGSGRRLIGDVACSRGSSVSGTGATGHSFRRFVVCPAQGIRASFESHPSQGMGELRFPCGVARQGLSSDDRSQAGWLNSECRVDLSPRRVIQPRPGHLTLFPTYMWHGTVPFEAPENWLTVAFDMQPRQVGR